MADSARRTVRVIEDDAGIRELLHLHLDLAGFTIDEVADGCQALDRTRSTPNPIKCSGSRAAPTIT